MTEASPGANTTFAAIMTIRGVSKAFGGTRALSSAMLHFYPGEVHSLISEEQERAFTLITQENIGDHKGWIAAR